MSERREKKRRYNLRLEYISRFYSWLGSEPPMWMFWMWRKWKNSRPIWDNSEDSFCDMSLFYERRHEK